MSIYRTPGQEPSQKSDMGKQAIRMRSKPRTILSVIIKACQVPIKPWIAVVSVLVLGLAVFNQPLFNMATRHLRYLKREISQPQIVSPPILSPLAMPGPLPPLPPAAPSGASPIAGYLRSSFRTDPSSIKTYEVININDGGNGSLRQAILDANKDPGPLSRILFRELPRNNYGVTEISLIKPLPPVHNSLLLDSLYPVQILNAGMKEEDCSRLGFQKETVEVINNTFTVASTADSGKGSLRQAILDSSKAIDCHSARIRDQILFFENHESADHDKLVVGVDQYTIFLSTPLPLVTHPLALTFLHAPDQVKIFGSGIRAVDCSQISTRGITLTSTRTVTNTDDSGRGSLRQSILDANDDGYCHGSLHGPFTPDDRKDITFNKILFHVGTDRVITLKEPLPVAIHPLIMDGRDSPRILVAGATADIDPSRYISSSEEYGADRTTGTLPATPYMQQQARQLKEQQTPSHPDVQISNLVLVTPRSWAVYTLKKCSNNEQCHAFHYRQHSQSCDPRTYFCGTAAIPSSEDSVINGPQSVDAESVAEAETTGVTFLPLPDTFFVKNGQVIAPQIQLMCLQPTEAYPAAPDCTCVDALCVEKSQQE